MVLYKWTQEHLCFYALVQVTVDPVSHDDLDCACSKDWLTITSTLEISEHIVCTLYRLCLPVSAGWRACLMLSHVYVTWPFRPIRRDLRLPVRVTCMSHFGCIDQSGETLEKGYPGMALDARAFPVPIPKVCTSCRTNIHVEYFNNDYIR